MLKILRQRFLKKRTNKFQKSTSEKAAKADNKKKDGMMEKSTV